MHLGVIMILAGAVFRPVAGRTGAGLCALLLGLLYLVLIGPRAGLVRAYLFACLALAARIADRRRPLAEILALSFLVQITLFPDQIFSTGFLLSYASLAGIAVCLPAVHRILARYLPGILEGPLSVGIAAQTATTPLLLVTFGVVYPVGAVASAVLGPIVLAIMVVGAGAAMCLLAGLHLVSGLTVPLLEAAYRIADRIANLFAGAPALRSGGAMQGGEPRSALVAVSWILAALFALSGLRTLYGRDRVVFT
jgi:competence protein ComEC